MADTTWAAGTEVYSPVQVEAVLVAIGIQVVENAGGDFLSYCPFHHNHDTPAFFTSGTEGTSACLNPACIASRGLDGYRLTLDRLVMRVKKCNKIEAKRIILLNKSAGTFEQRFDSINTDDIELKEFPADAIEVMHERFMLTQVAKDYMKGRGFERETMEFFKVGYTPATTGYGAPVYRPHDMIVVPAYDHKSKPVGLVGRSLVGKEFKNYGPDKGGTGFRKAQIVWNLQNARKHETIILTESTFDAMRVHQAGYPNVGALLGGTLSKEQEGLLKRHFSRIIIMTDNETGDDRVFHRHCRKCLNQRFDYCQGHQPGRDLGMQIVERLPGIRVSWAVFDERHVYANNVKDASDMTDKDIVTCLRNAIPHFDYLEWVA